MMGIGGNYYQGDANMELFKFVNFSGLGTGGLAKMIFYSMVVESVCTIRSIWYNRGTEA